jgi:hypothetical protein
MAFSKFRIFLDRLPPYPPLEKVEPKWSKTLSTFGKGGAKNYKKTKKNK